MKKIVILMAAVFALLVSCANDSGGAPIIIVAGTGETSTGTTTGTPTTAPTTGAPTTGTPTTGTPTTGTPTGAPTAGTSTGTGAASDPYSGKLTVKGFSKYKAIGAAASKSKISASVAAGDSANTNEEDDGDNVHLVGQDSDGNIETISVESDGQDSDINERPLQFYKAFKRFVFFMYWPKNSSSYPGYGNLLDYPQCYSYWDSSSQKKKYEPMLVMDKSTGKIYSIDNSEYATDDTSVHSKWYQLGQNTSSVVESGDCFYILYQASNTLNYYALKLGDDQLQEICLVKNASSNSFSGIYMDRFGHAFANGNSSTIKYYMAIDGSKTKINYEDNLYVSSSVVRLSGVYYYPDGTFSTNLKGSADVVGSDSQYYHGTVEKSIVNGVDAMIPKLYAPLFMAANGYVYKASSDSLSRKDAYKRFNANGQWEDCDWVPSETQEFSFSPDELLTKKDNVEYYFASTSNDYFNNASSYNLTKTVPDFQLLNSSGQPATIRKYDFDKRYFTLEEIPVKLDSYEASWTYNTYNASARKNNVIYKIQYSDSSKSEFTTTEIPLVGYTSSNSYSYYASKYAATSKHIFFVKDGDLLAYNIEDGTKNSACSKSDAIYGSITASEGADKVYFTATSLSSNASISGTIDDNGNVTQNTTNYEIKYLSPLN